MAVDSPVLYNGYWVYLRYSLGSTHLNPSDKQITNATKIYNGLLSQGYTSISACGILGNMQTESGLSPGALDRHLSSLPNNGEHLSDLTNTVMLNYASQNDSGYGTGLIQWDSYGSAHQPYGNVIASTAIRNNMMWYDGDLQLLRLSNEYQYDPSGGGGMGGEQFTFWYPGNHSPRTTWAEFKSFTGSVSEAADIFRQCRERSSGDPTGNQNRRDNAQYWYDYFSGIPPEPPTPTTDWISGATFSTLATAYDPDITGVNIPYNQKDCIGYVNMVWQDIPVVYTNGYSLPNGTNTFWRRNITPYPSETYNTTSPDNQNPTPVLWYKDTISNYLTYYNDLPPGCLLFHQISEIGPPAIPPQYAGDGIGNFAHVGIYIGNCQVMQSGGRDKSSVPGGGVHRTTYNSLTSSDFTSAWNYMAYVCYVDTSGGEPGPEPPEPPEPGDVPYWLLLWYTQKRKDGVKNAIRKYKY